MTNKWGIVAFGVCLLLAGRAGGAPSIGSVTLVQAQCHSLTISIQVSPPWEPSPHPNKSTYIVYRELNGLTEMVRSNESVIDLKGLKEFEPYNLYVEARSRRKKVKGIPFYRKVGSLLEVTPDCNTVGPFSPALGDVRLRHEATGKCIFGNPVDGGAVKTWGCWQDPEMALSLEPLGGSEIRIRIRAKGKCLFGNPVNGGVVKNWGCWSDPNMIYIREELGNNRIRLRHKNTGQCMYGGPGDGDPVKNWPCWDDPAMVWIVDPY